jgi:DNA polymerase
MNAHGSDPRRQVLRQYLVTDALLGLEEVPLRRRPMVRQGASGLQPVVADAAQAAAHPARSSRRLSVDKAAEMLATLDRDHVRGCRKCVLCEERRQTVFGVGNPQARLLFVGEGPGRQEDEQGEPFVGAAGALLDRMIKAMGLQREDTYICNVVKCRPPDNRTPYPDEIAACKPYLFEQLRIVEPEIMIALGAPSAKLLLDTTAGINRLRGRFHDFTLHDSDGTTRTIPLMPTYHPAYLLRCPQDKIKTWEDLQQVMQRLGLRPQG